MAKYDPLRDHLAQRPATAGVVQMSFAEVEALVGPLPPSARKHTAWWANDSKVEAQAWRAAGWHVASFDQLTEQVVFGRGAIGGTYVARKRAEASRAQAATPAPPSPDKGAAADSEEWVQSMVVAHLVAQGWQIRSVANTATKEQGVDVLAVRGERTLAVEVKGYPGTQYADPRRAGQTKPTRPSTQARPWYAQAVLKAMLTRNEHPNFDLAIALPNAPTYRSLIARTKSSLDRLDVQVLLVTADGRVQES